MRTLLCAIAALGAAGLSVTAPASATTLHAHRVTAAGTWAGRADATTAAYRTPGSAAVVLRSDDGTARTVAPPDGCAIGAAGAGLLASACGPPTVLPVGGGRVELHLAVSRLDGSLVTRFDTEGQADVANGGGGSGLPSAVGTQWIRLATGAKQGGDWWEDVNWHTGAVRQSLETDAATTYAAGVHGRWVLVRDAAGFTLRHCGLARPVRLPEGFAPAALGDGWVAGYTTVAHRSPRVDVIRLSDRRRFAVAGVPGPLTRAGANRRLAFTRGRLYAFVDGFAAIDTIMLPRR